MINLNSKIFVAGHKGLVGSAILRKLKKKGYKNLIVVDRKRLDLRDYKKVTKFLKTKKPNFIFIAAAKVGGIYYNLKYKADFITENLQIQNNLIHGAYKCGIKNLIFLGSSCVYPKFSKQPIKEDYLLSGKLEETNDAYAIAKIAGIKMCESYNRQFNVDYRSVMPTNLYGENDNFHLLNSHVIPAMMRRFHESKISGQKEVIVWGTGKPKREFLHVDDMASGIIFLLENYFDSSPVNLGTGEEVTIKELAKLISKVVDYKGQIIFDESKPDGIPRKILDSSKIQNLGWKPSISLFDGLEKTYHTYLDNFNK